MSYLYLVGNDYPSTYSKEEAIEVLERYKTQITQHEYDSIFNSLCSHALENIFLSIALLRDEITLEEIVQLAKAS